MSGLLTASEVAARFGVCVPTVWGWVRLGRLEVVRTLGNRMRFTEQALQDARDKWPGGDTDRHGGDEGPSAPDRAVPVGAPAPRTGGCGYPLPDDDRAPTAWCLCGARIADHD